MQRHLAAIMAADVAGYSTLMAKDEATTLATLKSCLGDIIEPAVAARQGRVFKTMGDGFLVEFASVVEAVACAGDIQRGMAARNQKPETLAMQLRIGVHLGDVIADGDDVFGDGVNIAARIQALAEPGGIRISRQAYDQVEGKLGISFRALGEQNLKNIPRPVAVFAANFTADGAPIPAAMLEQEIKYCRAQDGTRLAYAIVGQGPPLVKTGSWVTHLERDWDTAIYRPIYAGLARDFTLVRYDARGNGLSDWEVTELSLDVWVNDLETVVDAAGLDRFPLLGLSQGGAVAITYAARHPERVSHLILCGTYARGFRRRGLNAEQLAAMDGMRALMRVGWGSDNPAYRQLFTTQFMPDASKEHMDAFNDLQRIAISPEGAARYFDATGDIDVTGLLSEIQAPTLVLHVREDGRAPIELGREIAAGIQGARFVAMPGRNHVFQEGEPAMERFLEEVRLFLRS